MQSQEITMAPSGSFIYLTKINQEIVLCSHLDIAEDTVIDFLIRIKHFDYLKVTKPTAYPVYPGIYKDSKIGYLAEQDYQRFKEFYIAGIETDSLYKYLIQDKRLAQLVSIKMVVVI